MNMNKNTKLISKLKELENLLPSDEQELEQDDSEEKINEARNKIYSSRLVSSNEIIDLYKEDNHIEGYYDIYLHNTFTYIGHIGVQPFGKNLNNISYEIDDKYRGNGYATQAVYTLTNYLSENGVENIVIISKKDNKSSIRVIEKFHEMMPAFEVEIENGENVAFYYFKINNKLQDKAIKR